MLIEQKLPLGVTPESDILAEPAERERLMRVFDRGLGNPSAMSCRCLPRTTPPASAGS